MNGALGPAEVVEAPATIHGVGLAAGDEWSIGTSEI